MDGLMGHRHYWVPSVERFLWACQCGETITKEEMSHPGPMKNVSQKVLTEYWERREEMTLRKHGVGEVIPEPDDSAEAQVFSEADEAMLREELAEVPKDDDGN